MVKRQTEIAQIREKTIKPDSEWIDPEEQVVEVQEEDKATVEQMIVFLDELLQESTEPNGKIIFLDLDGMPFSEAIRALIDNTKKGKFFHRLKPGGLSPANYIDKAWSKSVNFTQTNMKEVDPLDPNFQKSNSFMMAQRYALKAKRLKPIIDLMNKYYSGLVSK